MRILVTGAAGFIGRWVVAEALARGDEVLAVDNLATGDEQNLAEFGGHPGLIGFERGDVRSESDDRRWIAGAGIDAVAHLAASISVQDSIDEPGATFDNDVVGTFRLLEAARTLGTTGGGDGRRGTPPRFLFMSTCMVYDRARNGAAIGEEDATRPASPYAAAKLAGEALTSSYGHAYGLPVTIVRPFNTYGPHQRSVGEGGVVAIFTRRSILGEPLRIYGDGTQTRDLLYVTDCASFVLDALHDERATGLVLNAGTGHDVSINELAAAIEKDAARITHVPHIHPQSEIAVLRCDPTRARRVLGWQPQVSLDDGLRRVRDWMAERLGAGLPVA
jgi:UDP-glucose 4-epimerase